MLAAEDDIVCAPCDWKMEGKTVAEVRAIKAGYEPQRSHFPTPPRRWPAPYQETPPPQPVGFTASNIQYSIYK